MNKEALSENGLGRVRQPLDWSNYMPHITQYFMPEQWCMVLLDEIIMDTIKQEGAWWHLVSLYRDNYWLS